MNEWPLKNIGTHGNIRHRWFQRAPISFSLAFLLSMATTSLSEWLEDHSIDIWGQTAIRPCQTCTDRLETSVVIDRVCNCLSSRNSTQLNEHIWTQVLTPQCPHLFNTTTYETTHLLLHVLIYLQFRSGRLCNHTRQTSWCIQNLSKRALNWFIVLTSTTQFGKLFQMLMIRAEK